MSHLIEPDARRFITMNLRQCHEKKLYYFSIALNIGIFVVFVGLIAVILYFRYKGAPSAAEIHQIEVSKKQQIMNKLRQIQETELAERVLAEDSTLVTQLPSAATVGAPTSDAFDPMRQPEFILSL